MQWAEAEALGDNPRRRSLLLIGPVQPPKGGVSVHIERLVSLLEHDFVVSLLDEARSVKIGIPNIRRMSPLAYLAAVRAADVVHVHSFPIALKLVHVILARLLCKRVVLTVHSMRDTAPSARIALSVAARLAHVCVAVSDRIADQISASSRMIPAFIPPVVPEPPVDSELAMWIARRQAERRAVFVANASRLESFHGRDLYGLDVIIEAFRHPVIARQCACVFIIGSPEFDPDRLADCRRRLQEAAMEPYFRLHLEPESFFSLVAIADGTIRASLSDGDALSVRESLHLGKLTIASDCAKRPDGTVIFETGDARALSSAIVEALRAPCEQTPAPNDLSDYRSLYLQLYR